MDKWDLRFMRLTEEVGNWASCLRRRVGAIIVKGNRVMTTGYNGAPAGIASCIERGKCLRIEQNIRSGTHAELCYAAHAEQNAIIQAARYGVNIDGATLYCTHQPCVICAKMIINAGIKRVVYKEGYPDEFSMRLFGEAGTVVEKLGGEGCVEMHLLPEPFALLKEGKKTVEIRLCDEKRRAIGVGSEIVFRSGGESVKTSVIALYRADTLEELLSMEGLLGKAGWQKGTSPSEAAAQMRAIYPEEEERRYGALGIELKLMTE